MRLLTALIAVLVATVFIGCGGPKKEVGESCVHDRECDNGFCLDVSLIETGARGRRCTRGCGQTVDCPTSAGTDAECRRFGGRSLCYYVSWGSR